MAALDNVSNAVEAALSSVGNGSHALRSFAPGLDFVYLTPLMCVCRAPRNESEAERLSSYFNAHHPHNHKIFNCCGYPDSGTISEATVEAGATGTSTSASPVPPASMLISSRYFESCEDYRGPITLKQLIYCANRAEAYLAANPHGVLVFMCESGAGKSCAYAASFMLFGGTVLSAQEAVESVSKERNPLVPPELDTHKQPRLHTRLQAPLPPMVLQHTRALGIPSHVRYISYFEGLLRSSGDQWKCNTAQLSRVRVVGGVPNLHQSLLQKGCKLHAVVQVAQYQLPLEAYMALGSDKASPMSKRVGGREREKAQQGKEAAAEALFAELTGSEPAVLHTVFDQLQVAYGGDKQRLPFYSQSDATASTTPSRRPGGPDSPGAAAVAGKSAGIDLDLSAYDVRVRGDCILHLYSEDVRVMSIAFHTAFVAGSGYLQFDAAVVDLACEDRQHKAFPAATKVELFLTPVDDSILLNVQNVDAMLR